MATNQGQDYSSVSKGKDKIDIPVLEQILPIMQKLIMMKERIGKNHHVDQILCVRACVGGHSDNEWT